MNPNAIAIKATLSSLDRQRRAFIAAQDADNAACKSGAMSPAEFLARWGKRQRSRISLETKDFWLRCQLEEVAA